MGIANSWVLRVKRKDNKELTPEQAEAILNFDFYEDDKPDELFDLRNNYPEDQICFYTDSYEAEDKVETTLKKFTAENPIISIQVDKCCTEYGDAQYSRCNYSNGASEQMWGFVNFEEPQEVFY